MWRPHCVPSQTLPSIPHDDSAAVPDRPTGKNCSDRPCRTTLTGSWTVAGCVSALSRNQDPIRTFCEPRRSAASSAHVMRCLGICPAGVVVGSGKHCGQQIHFSDDWTKTRSICQSRIPKRSNTIQRHDHSASRRGLRIHSPQKHVKRQETSVGGTDPPSSSLP